MYSFWIQSLFELIGTMVLVLMGDGVVACTSLNKSKGQGAGWVVVTLAWGFAVMCGVFIAGPYSGAHLNPAVTIGLAVAGSFKWAWVPGFIIAQMAGAILGGALVYVYYKDQFDATEDKATILGVFCTAPAVRNLRRNFICEFIGTFLLVFVILDFSTKGNTPVVGLGALGSLPVTMLIMAIGMSLGGATGYAINPARDLGPRIAHALLPIKNKGGNDWEYSIVPGLGPVAGGVFAALFFLLIYKVIL
ncbi:MAG: aquaporin family protein [Bacteroidales bacterium]|nr:aquaporin family protein [Bacteroidales bacterium]